MGVGAGTFTLVTAIVGGVYKFMDNSRQHWKEAYNAEKDQLAVKIKEISDLQKELGEIKKDPLSPARSILEANNKFISEQVAKFRATIAELQEKLEEKDRQLKSALEDREQDRKKIEFYEEMKDSLRRKIAEYEETILELMSHKDTSERVFLSMDRIISDPIIPDILEKLQRRIVNVEASSFQKTVVRNREQYQSAAIENARRTRKALAEKPAEIEGIAHAQVGHKIPLDTGISNAHRNRNSKRDKTDHGRNVIYNLNKKDGDDKSDSISDNNSEH